MSNYPDDIGGYAHAPGSPFYEDPSDGLDELDDEEVERLITSAEQSLEDTPLSYSARRDCELALEALNNEQRRRQS